MDIVFDREDEELSIVFSIEGRTLSLYISKKDEFGKALFLHIATMSLNFLMDEMNKCLIPS